VATERILPEEQTAEMGYLRRVLGVTLRDKEHRSEIRKARDIKPEIPAMLVRPCIQNVPGKNGYLSSLSQERKNGEISPSGYSLHPRESGPKFVQGPGGVTTSPTLLGPVLVWSQQNYMRLMLIVRYLGSP